MRKRHESFEQLRIQIRMINYLFKDMAYSCEEEYIFITDIE